MKVVAYACAIAIALPLVAYGVVLEWDYVENPLAPAVSFSMYRDVGCAGDFLFVASIARVSQQYTDNTVVAGGRYCYYVTAIGADGRESGASNALEFQVPLPPPNPPSNLHLK